MTLTETISRTAASNPTVAVAVAQRGQKIALLAGLAPRSEEAFVLLGAVNSRSQEASQLLASAAPHLGQSINQTA